jgi:hypothetical protein
MMKTVELLVEQKPWNPRKRKIAYNRKVHLQIDYGEVQLGLSKSPGIPERERLRITGKFTYRLITVKFNWVGWLRPPEDIGIKKRDIGSCRIVRLFH